MKETVKNYLMSITTSVDERYGLKGTSSGLQAAGAGLFTQIIRQGFGV